MPTGYTAPVQSGEITEFKDFALQCARAFGALVMMRDEPMDAKIPDAFEPSDYHTRRLAEAKAELERLRSLTPEQIEAEAEKAWQTELDYHNKRVAETALQRKRYEDMLAKVEAWVPPTPDHTGLKEFMASQLRESIEFDCRDREPPKRKTSEEWLHAALKSALWNVEYHEKGQREEIERTEGRNRWLRELRESLKAAA